MDGLWLHGYWPSLLEGALITIEVSVLSGFLAIILGLAGATAKLSESVTARTVGNVYTTLIRGVPDLVLMLLLYFGGQVFVNSIGERFGWDYVEVSPFAAGVLTIGFIYGAYLTETFRGAILAVPRGQVEAAEAYGMSRAQVMFHVLMPQMIRHALPGLNNNWLVLMKSTALVSVIGLDELVRRADIAGKSVREPFLFFVAVAAIYLLFTLGSSPLLQRLEGHVFGPLRGPARLIDGFGKVVTSPALRRAMGLGLKGLGIAVIVGVLSGFVYWLATGFAFEVVAETFHLYFAGLATTIVLVTSALLIGLCLAIPLAVARTSENRLLNWPVHGFTFFFRGSPLLVQLYIFYYGFAQFEWVRESPLWLVIGSAWACCLLVFTLNTAAYTTEIIRGAVGRTPVGEIEAARACGMSPSLLYRRILLPSALRRSLPTYGNEVVFMLHGSAVASVVTVQDLLGVARVVNSRYYTPYEAFLTVAVFYLALTFAIVFLFRFLEARYMRHLRPREAGDAKGRTIGQRIRKAMPGSQIEEAGRPAG